MWVNGSDNKALQGMFGQVLGGPWSWNIDGRTYFVDYDTGNDSNDGRSWAAPFKLLSRAITVSEAFRLAGGEQKKNIYTRNRIMIKSASVDQPAITALPNYCDLIGVGGNPNGNGVGKMATIGGGTGTNGTAAVDAPSCRGCNFYNLQFESHDTTNTINIFEVDTLMDCRFVDCAFMGDDQAGAVNATFMVKTTCGSTFWKGCRFGGTNSAWPAYGMYFSAGNLTQGGIEDCVVAGTTAAIYIHASVGLTNQFVIKNNIIGDLGGGCARGIDDDSTGHAVIAGNFVTARTTAMDLTARGTVRAIGNRVVSNVTAAVEY